MTTVSLQALTLARPGGAFRLGPLDASWPLHARVALVGPSGSGKTTLLRLLAGLEAPDAGRIAVGGTPWTDGRRQITPPSARGIGFVFQDGALWPHMTALEHVRFVDPAATPSAAEALLERVGLAGFAKRKPNELSGGERQRVALARALAGKPRLLLLDEPMASVDVHLREELAQVIASVAQERELGVVLVTHDRRDAFALAHEIVVLHQGRIVESGDALRLARAPQTAFTAAFLGAATCIPLPASNNGHVMSPFGSLASPTPGRDVVLALLPGHVRLTVGDTTIGDTANGDTATGGTAPARGRVLSVHPDAAYVWARVQVGAHVVHARCDGVVPKPDDQVGLELQHPPRLLDASAEVRAVS